jgi:hypothetical protein
LRKGLKLTDDGGDWRFIKIFFGFQFSLKDIMIHGGNFYAATVAIMGVSISIIFNLTVVTQLIIPFSNFYSSI